MLVVILARYVQHFMLPHTINDSGKVDEIDRIDYSPNLSFRLHRVAVPVVRGDSCNGELWFLLVLEEVCRRDGEGLDFQACIVSTILLVTA